MPRFVPQFCPERRATCDCENFKEVIMKASLALVQRLGFFSQKPPANDQTDDRYDMRLQRLVRPTEGVLAKGLVFKTSR